MVTDPPVRIKHAFVTGATGIVGVPLCKQLVDLGVRVTAYSRSGGEFGLSAEVAHVRGDILDPKGLANAAQCADVIFHVAAAVHGAVSAESDFRQINVVGTKNVVDAALAVGAKLVHVSTVNVDLFRRGDLVDAYGMTKSEAEEVVGDAVENGLDAVVVRPTAVFGNVRGRSGLIVDRVLSGSLKVLPAPSRRISPVWAGDLALALIAAGEQGRSGATYTVAGPTVSTGEFVAAICESAGVGGPLASIPAWMVAVPLQLAWWGRGVTRWIPPVSVVSLGSHSVHDGSQAARDLGFSYTPVSEIAWQ
jgi:dihydroflavonol-4-reductase